MGSLCGRWLTLSAGEGVSVECAEVATSGEKCKDRIELINKCEILAENILINKCLKSI